MPPLPVVDVDVVVENGVSVWQPRHLEFGVLLHVDLKLLPLVILQKGPQGPHDAKYVDLFMVSRVRIHILFFSLKCKEDDLFSCLKKVEILPTA